MSRLPLSGDSRHLQAHLLNVAAELLQTETALLHIRECIESLLVAHRTPEPERSPLEQMYEDLERAIRAAPSPTETTPRTQPLPAAGPRKRRVALQVVTPTSLLHVPPPTHRSAADLQVTSMPDRH